MAEISKKLLEWRKKQKRGAIMKPETFEKIVRNCIARTGFSKERCMKIAGSAYWKTARAKYQK